MRDYLIIAIVLLSLPIGIFRPFYGLLVYAWIGYMYPHELAWSFAKTFPVAKLSAISLIVGTLINGGINVKPLKERENLLMMLMWAIFTMTSLFALSPDRAWASWFNMSKILVIAFVVSMLVTDRKRIHQFLLVVALSLGYYGVKGGIFSLATGGSYMIWGPGDSIIGANNNIGLALNMLLPILWYVAAQETGWRKRALQAGFFLTIPTILFTYSRASELTAPVIVMLIAWKSKYRYTFIGALVVAAILVVPFVPQRLWDRVNTVTTYEEDASAMSRIDNWAFCWRLALDNPLTGAGFDFQSRDVFARYAPEFLIKYNGKVWDTHSIYLSMLASHGFPGLIVFLAMIFSAMLSCWRLKLSVRAREDLAWVRDYSDLVQLSLLALLINGAFVNMEYFELVYHCVALVASLKVICYRELADTRQSAVEPGVLIFQPHSA